MGKRSSGPLVVVFWHWPHLAGQGWVLCAPHVRVPLFPGAHWVDKCRFGEQSLFLGRPFRLILRGAGLLCLFLDAKE